jgi:hypothetical protein
MPMQGTRWIAALGPLAALALWPTSAQAGAIATTIEAGGENKFSPKVGEYIVISTNFFWFWGAMSSTTRRHDVVQDAGLFRSPGGPRKSFPEPGFSVSASAGSFPYHCSVHGGKGGQGMSGKVRAIPGTYAAPTDDEIPFRWAVKQSNTGNQYDVRFRTEGGEWRLWKRNTANLQGTFGQGDNPVDVKPGRTYRFQGRSERSGHPSKHSGWSPTATAVTP